MKDDGWKDLSAEERSWCLYALYFSGFWSEAESWRSRWFPKWHIHLQAHLFFARTVALARGGKLDQARLEWLDAWKESGLRRSSLSGGKDSFSSEMNGPVHSNVSARGWMFQTQSFLQMQRSRFSSAAHWSALAERESLYASDLMLRAMAADMQAHASVREGFYASAIRNAQQALQCARAIENRGIENAVRVSIACWQSARGEDPLKTLRTLRSLLQEKSFHDTYSQNVLLLEIARTLMLRGEFDQSRKVLMRVEKNLSGTGRTAAFRQKIALAQRKALLLRLEGHPKQALAVLERVFADIPSFEVSLMLEVRGQMISACSEAKIIPPAAWLDEERKWTVQLRTRQALRYLERRARRVSAHAEYSDPMGELVDALSTRTMDASLISLFLSRGFQGLLALKMDRPYDNMLFFIPATKEFLLLTRSGVTVCALPASLQLFALAACLGRRLCSKGEIVRAVWNRRYQPERDDAGVYVLVRRLRRLLGSQDKLLLTDRRGYSLNAEVRMWAGAESVAKQNASTVGVESSVSSLRLLELKNWLRGRVSFTAEEWQNESGISRASACRDISELLRSGDLKKVGRGPASVYMRVDSYGVEMVSGG
jgi:DNA-binding winged helix-turn-helix (wHTH) protein